MDPSFGHYPPPSYDGLPGTTIPGDVVKIYCEENPDYYLTAVDGQVVLALGNESDPRQQWIMDTSWGINVKDEEGFPAFAVVNKSTMQALRHGSREKEKQWIKVDTWGLRVKDEAGFPAFALVNKATLKPLKHGRREWDQVHLAHTYEENELEEAILWTLSADVGNGYRCLRPVSNTNLNLDAKQAEGKHGGIKDGNELILFSWKKQSNQKWKMLTVNGKPIC